MANDYSIDYSPRPYQESGLGRGLSQLSTVMDALLQRKAAEAQQRRALEQQARLAAVDDARMQQQADEMARYHTATLEQQRAEMDAKEREAQAGRAEKVLPNVLEAVQAGDIPTAQTWGQQGGIKVGEAPRSVPENAVGDMLAQPAPSAPSAQAPDTSAAPFPFDILSAQQARMQTEAARRAEAAQADPLANLPPIGQAPATAPQGPLRYRIEQPGQEPIDYDPEQQRQMRIQRGGQLAADIGTAAPGGGPFWERATADVQRMARTGAYKSRDEMLADLSKRASFYELQAEENKRAAIAAAAQAGRTDKSHPAGERDVPNFDGGKAGVATSKEDAEAAKKKRAILRPIISQLDSMDTLVKGSGKLDRVPGVGQFTERQQRIKGMLDTMLAPITQALGSGTPQEAEAKRKLETLTVSFGQGPDVASQNIAGLKAYLRDIYEQEVGSVVPGYQPQGQAKPSAKSLADEIMGGP